MAYCSQENAIVGRCNKEVNRHIRAFVFERATIEGYQSIIPFVQRILNASVNDTMRTSPTKLLFGNALNLDRGILLPHEELLLPLQSVTRSTSRMLHDQEVLLGTASELLRKADEAHTDDQPTNLTVFATDSYVLALECIRSGQVLTKYSLMTEMNTLYWIWLQLVRRDTMCHNSNIFY